MKILMSSSIHPIAAAKGASALTRLALGAALLWTGPLAAEALLPPDWVATVKLTNRVDFAVEAVPVKISLAELAVAANEVDGLRFTRAANGAELDSQFLPADWTHPEDRIFLLVPMEAGATETLVVRGSKDKTGRTAFLPRAYAEISRKFGGEWQPNQTYSGGEFVNVNELTVSGSMPDHNYYMRYEGPGWESDKVGYRIYLDGRNGFDVFGKLTPAMVLGHVGQDGYASYHQMANWGMDILKVAQAVGIGGFGAFHNGAVMRVRDVDTRSTRVSAAGPLYAAHDMKYENWRVGNRSTDLTARVAIHGGAYHTFVNLHSSDNLPLATGIVRLDGGELIPAPEFVVEKDYTWLATFGNQSMNEEPLGLAVFYRPRDVTEIGTDAHNHYVRLRARGGLVSYAFTAVWGLTEGEDFDKAAFVAYLERTAQLLNRPPLVRVENRMDRIHKRLPTSSAAALDWSTRVAETAVARRGQTLHYGSFNPEGNRMARWEYTTALLAQAIDTVAQVSDNSALADYAASLIDSFVDEDGTIRTYSVSEYNIDHVAGGPMLQRLFERTGDVRYHAAIELLMSQLASHPRTNAGGFWHKKVYPYQMWLDGLFMGSPFYARQAVATGNPSQLDDAIRQFEVMFAKGRHPTSGWLMHAWDESRAMAWADPQTGLSPQIWGRSVGWFAMALVDVMESIKDDPARLNRLLPILQATAAQIRQQQDPQSGMWFQIMDRPDLIGNYLESSASSMFVYALAKAIRHGWLDTSFTPIAQAGFDGLVRNALSISADGSVRLGQICEVAGLSEGRDGSTTYYLSEPVVFDDSKGTGPFILAGVEIHRLLEFP